MTAAGPGTDVGKAVNEAQQALTEVASTSIVSTALVEAVRRGLKGIAAAAIGWLFEWMARSAGVLPGLAPDGEGWVPTASLAFTVIVYAAVGAVYGTAAVMLVRRVLDGSLIVPRPNGPSLRIEPVWWGRAIRDAMVVFVILMLGVGLWGLGQWAAGTGNRFAIASGHEGLQYVSVAVGLALAAGGMFRLFEIFERLLGLIKPLLLRSAALWFVICASGACFFAALTTAVVTGVAFLVAPAFVAVGLGSPLRLATAVGVLPLALQVGYAMGRLIWEERDASSATLNVEEWVPQAQNDFRNWDLEAETSVGGTAQNGYPFFLWRESADDRLGLSRPRYCCITDADGELQFTFFNPSEDVRSTGTMAVSAAVAVLVVGLKVVEHWSAAKPLLPYALDERTPPALTVLSTAFAAALCAGLAGGAWFVAVTLLRWYRNRFAGDGRMTSKPLSWLLGFVDMPASETGAKSNGEVAKTGHGLVAAFNDGSIMVLTANAWDYPSIVAKHRALTQAFREPRDEFVMQWNEGRKRDGSPSVVAAPSQGLPETL